jgi:hypothetical protein
VVRRLQLLEPEHQSSTRHLAALGERIRGGLLRYNKVIPPVLAVLALLIFAWLIAGVLIGGSGEEKEEEQASNQASLAQEPEDPDGGGPETPAPGVENRDTDSYAAFEEPKDPFYGSESARDLLKAGKAKEDGNERTDGGGRDRDGGRGGDDRDRDNDGRGRDSGRDRDAGRDRGDSIDQSFPRGRDSDAGNGAADQGGTGGLFDSGGDLAPP